MNKLQPHTLWQNSIYICLKYLFIIIIIIIIIIITLSV